MQQHLERDREIQAENRHTQRVTGNSWGQTSARIAAVHQPAQRHQSVQTDARTQQHASNKQDLQCAPVQACCCMLLVLLMGRLEHSHAGDKNHTECKPMLQSLRNQIKS